MRSVTAVNAIRNVGNHVRRRRRLASVARVQSRRRRKQRARSRNCAAIAHGKLLPHMVERFRFDRERRRSCSLLLQNIRARSHRSLFETELAYTKQTIVYGTLESNSASYWNTGTTKFADHTGQSPDSVNDYWGWGGGQPPASCGSPSRATCTTYFSYPFYKWGSPHNLWHIGSGNYLCDDDNISDGISQTTTHQIWFKKKQ